MGDVNRAAAWGATTILLILFTAGASAGADEPGDTINVAYAQILGSGIYEIGDRRAYVLNMPFAFVLYEPENRDWAMNLLLPVTVGVLDVPWDDFWGSDLDGDRLQTLSVVPGIEMDIPLDDHWSLKPFIQAGYVHDAKEDYDAWVYFGGLKGLARYQLGAYDVGLGAGITVAEQRPVSRGDNTGIGVIELGVDVRRALDMQLRGKPMELSVYAIASNYYNDLDLLDIEDEDFHIKRTYEIGLTLGIAQPVRFWGVDWQRLGMGYKWGDGLESITFNTGFPF